MTAADKLRELLATRPAMPMTEELVRWWRTADLVREVIDELDAAWNATGIAGSVRGGALGVRLSELVAKYKCDRDQAIAELAAERTRSAAERESMLVEIQGLQRRRPDAVEMARLDGEVARLRGELDRMRTKEGSGG